MTGSQVREDVSDAGRRSRSAADPVGRWKADVREGGPGRSYGTVLVSAALRVQSAAQHPGTARPRTVDSRTWLWKCCSRADTSSCPSILLHAHRRTSRVRALRRTIARGRRGYTVSRGRTPPRPQQARKMPLQLRDERWGTATAWAGLEVGAGLVRHSDSAVRQRRAPLRLGRCASHRKAPWGVAGRVGAGLLGSCTEMDL